MKKFKIIHKDEIADKGEGIYNELRQKLEPEHKGEFVVIEVDSSDYFLGKTPQEADGKASEKYPDKVFYLARIGYKTAFVRR